MKIKASDIEKLPEHIRSQLKTENVHNKPRRHKYAAIPTMVDGIRFASKREAARYGELSMLEKVGEIKELKLQVKFELVKNGHLIESYYADFTYTDVRTGIYIVEDAKGKRTATYLRKKKWMKNIFGIDIKET